ncbi:MAG: homoserine kinase [Methylotenera sp.]|nr:homoserine kinase [Methylotenera sp.]
MSVFTTVSIPQLQSWLEGYAIGSLVELKGISSGITNTNYFVTTTQNKYVLTLFEHNTMDELPYFIDLMRHLAQHQILCPQPISNQSGQALHLLNGKPAVLISCLSGRDISSPNATHCAAVGVALANMHVAGQSYHAQSKNQRGQDWFTATSQKVMPKLSADEQVLLKSELELQANLTCTTMPQGVIHGDLFRDNVLFDGDKLGGIIDFYYACNDCLAYDVAIAVNDWCLAENGCLNDENLNALMTAYQAVRPFNHAEHSNWHKLLRRAALRFWLSRLFDFHFPTDGDLTHAKDPNHFKRILMQRIALQ